MTLAMRPAAHADEIKCCRSFHHGFRMNNVTFENYPEIRDLTRKLSQDMQSRIASHLDVVKTHFRPAPVFGAHLTSGSNSSENPRAAAEAFAQLTSIYKQIAASPVFNLDTTLPDPIDITFATPVVFPYVYLHDVTTRSGPKRLTVAVPFRFVIAFPDYPFHELRSLTGSRGPKQKLRDFVLHYAVLNQVAMQNRKLLTLFEDLRLPIRSAALDEFGPLPITTIEAPAGSIRPEDSFLLQLAKFSGSDSAEELVDVEAWNKLADPMLEWFRREAGRVDALHG